MAERAGGPGGPGGGAELGSDGPGPNGDEVAQLAWKVGEDVDPPVEIVVDGESYVAGAGPPEGRVELTKEELRDAVADAESDADRDLTD
jgi:hypothetical protein